ncbi:GH116 family glycosyl-hydrolase [Fulvivirgaceae bacterium BMA10]|uniref:GH116 family glycosyl-hydrolase n=1 Tax=Splendidivirga corallicola TaxID=3051826 RepID=A0ABT8L0E7_9BACT|nr:GH116 family glycosyl-hydrolase [Fulvivirgaceae bacterium BMA10]
MNNSRRDFLKFSALGIGASTLPPLPIFAGPFTESKNRHLIPEDKKLSATWIKSLYERGKPEVLKDDELKYVGMPVGGIACGQLYLGGDGRLWLWHIFRIQYHRNPDSQLLTKMEQGGHYAYPDNVFKREDRSVEQGVAIRVKQGGKEVIKKLNNEGFKDISFRGEYPICKIDYKSDDLPVDVRLEAFSPFIPGELEKSSNPCTTFNYKIKNSSSRPIEVSLASWLENAVNPFETDNELGKRTVQLVSKKNRKTILFASESSGKSGLPKLEDQHGYGSLSWSLYNPSEKSQHALNIGYLDQVKDIFETIENSDREVSKKSSLNQKMLSAILETVTLEPGEEKEVTFVLGWYFPYLNQKDWGEVLKIEGIDDLKLHYFNRFKSANDVASYICDNFEELADGTRLWNQTWYDSSLPYWLLDRTFITLNCIASNTLVRFSNGRFWGWEGVECCPGTCTHVWQYAQALAHFFPEVERNFREVTDLSELGLNHNGALRHRAENNEEVAHDGHCGTIMRIYREHRMSSDDSFLRRHYPNIKKMVQFIIKEDRNRDGLLEGKQTNTLDAAWFGPMGWISSLYLGALLAGKEMAIEMVDTPFAKECDQLLKLGRKNIVKQLYNGEYFIHKPDKNYPKAINSNDGCHIDQVLGQSFAHNIGIIERVIPEKETVSALKSIWKYNFAPDAFDYQLKHKEIKGPRIYATQGEAATIMCTWPKGGDDKAVPGMDQRPDNPTVWSGPGIYFDEAMNGFEYQVASHMIWEGLVEKGLATARAVHDRYTAKKRNPFNEIECSDHYSRSMASYGVYLAACGLEYHGPKGYLAFDPKLQKENFKAAFTTANGWGSFEQERKSSGQINKITMLYGKMKLSTLLLGINENSVNAIVSVNGKKISFKAQTYNEKLNIGFEEKIFHKSDELVVEIKY